MIGTLICGRFRLEDQIGSGGMSTVYRAFDETLERWVAIKVLHGALSGDPLQLERFRREARTVARLSHPHIVTVIDAGEDGGQPFIVLEYVDGETLKARVRRYGGLPVPEATAYAIEVGRALMAAHAERLVHRDVKPQNVLIDQDGRAKVTDFGISRSLEEDGLTATGRVLGTTDYVAPEQALGEGVNEQSDLYSLGVCLYEMLTGQVPFKADSQVGVAMKHVREPVPDVRSARPEVSAALAAVVERATAKECRNRYATAAEMVGDLERALRVEVSRAGNAGDAATQVIRSTPTRAPAAPPARRRPLRRRLLAIGALVPVLAGGGVAAVLLARHHAPKRPAPAVRPAPLAPVALSGARVYDPFGDGFQHSDMAGQAVDGDRASYWMTETYSGGLGSKPGVGLYVSARTPVSGRRLDVSSPTPGARVEIYAGAHPPSFSSGNFDSVTWGKPVGRATLAATTRIPLATGGQRTRFYLIWITQLPPGNQAQIADVKLLA